MVEEAWWWIHLPIHRIWMLSNTLDMFGVDVGIIPCGSGASINAVWHHLKPWCDPWILPSQLNWDEWSWWKRHDGGSISPSPAYECSQTHWTCLEWSWNNFMWVWGLNQCSMTSYVAQVWPVNSAISINLRWTIMMEIAWWWIHLLIHRIWILSNTLDMFGVDVGIIRCGSGTSITAVWHHM